MSIRKRQSSADKLPAILDGKYFKIVNKESNGSILAECMICSKEGKVKTTWKGFIRPTSNFVCHLKQSHPVSFEEYIIYSGDQKAKRLKKNQHELTGQGSIEFPVVSSGNDRIDSLIVGYIIDCMRPLNTVEQPSFQKLVKGLNSQAKIMSRPTLRTKIGDLEFMQKEALRYKFNKTPYVSLTADAWKANSKSYFGVTAHWLNENLSRESAALALRRFRGSHNYSRIADLLTSIMDEFEVNVKTISCVTDNASNFVKAFKEFGALESPSSLEDEQSESSVEELDYDQPFENSRIVLPTHLRCACHVMSLIAKDCHKTISTRLSIKTLGKCSKLWNSFSRYSPLSDRMEENCGGKKFVRPTEVRVMELKQYLSQLCELVGIEALSELEYEFLEDYLTAMHPVASALDKLQSEKNCYYGLLGPTILRTVDLLDRIIAHGPSRRSAMTIATELKRGFQSRFGHVLDFEETAKDIILAATCHPFFKLKWVPTKFRTKVKDIFMKDGYFYDFCVSNDNRIQGC